MKSKISTVQKFILLVFLCVFIYKVNYAQDIRNSKSDSDTSILKSKKRLPILNGFRFIPSDIVKDPFVNTFLKVNAGTGLALDLNSYVKNFKGNVIDTISGDLTYVQAEIEFQYAINDWLSFNGNYGGSGRVGNNTYTILSSGVSYTKGFSLGSKVMLIDKEKFVLSANAEYNYTKVFMYSIFDYIKRAVQNYGDTTLKNDMLVEDNLSKLFIGVNTAYAPTNWFGFLGNAGFGFGKPFQQKERGNVRIGLAGSIDFLNVNHIKFPIGILGSVKYNAFSETGEDIDNIFTYGFRIGYTGHKDFDVGIESSYQKLNYRKSDVPIKSIQSAVKFRYYF
jgi:hypothetical protein